MPTTLSLSRGTGRFSMTRSFKSAARLMSSSMWALSSCRIPKRCLGMFCLLLPGPGQDSLLQHDRVLAVEFVDFHDDMVGAVGEDLLAAVVRLDRQFAVAAIDQRREL